MFLCVCACLRVNRGNVIFHRPPFPAFSTPFRTEVIHRSICLPTSMLCVEVLNRCPCVAEPEAPEEQERAVFAAFCSNTYSTPISFTRAPQYVAALFVASLTSISLVWKEHCGEGNELLLSQKQDRKNITVKGISCYCPRSTLSSCLSL